MSSRPQLSPAIITGSTLADLPNPASMPEGNIFRAHTGEALALEIDPATGTRSWQAFQSSVLSNEWPKYVVSTVAGPLAQFTDPQSAINAAVADGHGPTHPADVLMLSGIYTLGAPLIMAPGINVIGLGDEVGITGNIVASLASGSAVINGLTVTGELIIAGSAFFSLFVINSSFTPTTGDALSDSNSAGAFIVLENSQFVAVAGNGRGADFSTSASPFVSNCTFTGQGTGEAIAIVWNDGQMFTGCIFNGLVNGSGVGSGSANYINCTFNPVGTPIMQIARTAVANILGGQVTGSPTDPNFTSSGGGGGNATLIMNNVIFPSGKHVSIGSSNLNTAGSYVVRVYSENNLAGSTPFTLSASLIPDTVTLSQAGAWAVTLPQLLGVMTGLRISITNLAAAPGVLTLTPNGTDTVSGQGAGVPYATAAAARAVTLQTHTTGGVFDWRIIGISPL